MSNDFHVLAGIKVKPGHEAVARDALLRCSTDSLAEAGCLSYVPQQSVEDACQFFVLEHWQSQAALDAHMQSAHFKALMGVLEPLLATPLALLGKFNPLA